MRMRGTRRTLAALLAGISVLAGCSDGGDSGDQEGAEQSSTTVGTTTSGTGAPLERYAGYASEDYEEPSHWVCRPDAEDICDSDLTTTVVDAGGRTEVEEFAPAEEPAIDCFYVYPTISQDATTFSDWEASPDEEGFVTLQQAARLGEVCRVFAPVYRQRTLTALFSRTGDTEGSTTTRPEHGEPFDDVLDAFRTYMAADNDGRGFVLIGHSQGSAMLTQLIATEIDPHEDVRQLLAGAYLVGSTVSVPDGEVVGGTFDNVPLCTAADEVGCVTTWASFRTTAPPPEGSFFGRSAEEGMQAGCVNPAAVEGGSAELQAYFPADASASILSNSGASGEGRSWLAGTTIETPFVAVPGLVTGECVDAGGFNVLSVTVHPDAADLRADDIPGDLSPEWGLHLIDVSLVMGDIVDRIADQAAASG